MDPIGDGELQWEECDRNNHLLAKQFTEFEFSNKWMGWEQTTKRDKETGQLILDVKMPTVPRIDEVLKNAERFYEFVNGTSKQETKE